MKIKIFFAWFYFWVGFFFDRKKEVLYICPLPMIVIAISLKKRMSVDYFMERAEYLPDIMKDFHDCKDLFKRIDQIVYKATSDEGSHHRYGLPNWVDAHVYTVDFFLWYMGNHGYTLQEDERNVGFRSFDLDMERFRKEQLEELKKFFDMEKKNENN